VTVRVWIVGIACVVALFGAACGGEEPATDNGDANGSEAGSNGVEVVAENFAFSPTSIPVEAGAEVELTFTNNDDTQHSFTAESLGVDLVVDGGSSDSATFTAPDSGEADFVCKFHESMTGTITTDGSGAGGSGSGESDDSGDLDY
jgi:plastocyanin